MLYLKIVLLPFQFVSPMRCVTTRLDASTFEALMCQSQLLVYYGHTLLVTGRTFRPPDINMGGDQRYQNV